jgi:ribosomal protein S19E (S16A)
MEEDQVIKYDAQGVKLREAGCIGYAFLQRKCASVAAFRKDAEGSTAGIKKVLSQLEAEGFLRKLSKEEANELFETGATIYRINKGVL